MDHIEGTKLTVKKKRRPSYRPEDLEAFYRILGRCSELRIGYLGPILKLRIGCRELYLKPLQNAHGSPGKTDEGPLVSWSFLLSLTSPSREETRLI